MKDISKTRIAWLLPSMKAGAHWQPILSSFLHSFKNTIFYTTEVWQEFNQESSYADAVCQIGELRSIFPNRKGTGYQHGFLQLPLNVIFRLAEFRPHVIITNAFSVWSLLAVAFKPFFHWKIIVLYEGSTPSSDFRDSKLRSTMRSIIAQHTDAFVANNRGAEQYLVDFLQVKRDRIFLGAYLVPDRQLMTTEAHQYDFSPKPKRPVFLFIGQLISRKGIENLLNACALLKQGGINNFTLLVIGEGAQAHEFKAFANQQGVEDLVYWIGRVNYGALGIYFQQTDVFVFPTFEDTWGMVVLEAMAFGKPVLCSTQAGAAEMVLDGENGYLFDPYNSEELAGKMKYLIDNPQAIGLMGEKSKQIIADCTPETAIHNLSKAIASVIS